MISYDVTLRGMMSPGGEEVAPRSVAVNGMISISGISDINQVAD